jgi:hypothetical protein
VGTGCFLIRYINGHTKETDRQLKKFFDCFQQNIIPTNYQKSKLQSSHYINVSTDPLGTGRELQGIREGLLGNQWYREIITLSSKEP